MSINKYNKCKKNKKPAHNKRYMLRRLFGGSGFRSARSVALRARSHASLQPHFYCPVNLRFAYSGSKNVIYLERYVQLCLNRLENYN